MKHFRMPIPTIDKIIKAQEIKKEIIGWRVCNAILKEFFRKYFSNSELKNA